MQSGGENTSKFPGVSKELINEDLRKNDSIIRDTTPDDETLHHDSQLRLAEIHRYNQDTELRKTYADKVYKFMVGYTIAMFCIVFLSGWKFPTFYIETVPLTTLIGSSFASTTGLVYLVIKGLFPAQNRSAEKTEKSAPPNPDTKKGAEVQ